MFFNRSRNFHPLCSSLVLCLSVHCSSQSDYLYVSSDPLVLRTLGGTLYVLHPLPQLPPLVFFTCPLSLSSLQFSKWLFYLSSDPLVLRTLGATLYLLHPFPQLPPLVFFTCPLSPSSLQFSKWFPLSLVRPLSS